MSRLTPEREARLRAVFKDVTTTPSMLALVHEVMAEIEAVRLERDQASEALGIVARQGAQEIATLRSEQERLTRELAAKDELLSTLARQDAEHLVGLQQDIARLTWALAEAKDSTLALAAQQRTIFRSIAFELVEAAEIDAVAAEPAQLIQAARNKDRSLAAAQQEIVRLKGGPR